MRHPQDNPSLIDPARRVLVSSALCWPWLGRAGAGVEPSPSASQVPILVYHRFASTPVDSMTVRTAQFAAHLDLLQQLRCTVIPLQDWVAYRLGETATLPPRAVVLTADDGHRTQFEIMAPMLQKFDWPITLFIYPSAISNATYAMTWDQLRTLRQNPRISVQSHTYWHPNFLRERQAMQPEAFTQFANRQLLLSRDVLVKRLNTDVNLLAWPFGLSDPGLQDMARSCGYRAAFSLDNRSASRHDPTHAVPRHLMVDAIDPKQLAHKLEAAFAHKDVS